MPSLNVSALTSRIREESRRLGFFGIGIAPAGPLPFGEQFGAWIREGFHGEMRYMERQAAKRRDPELVLANARSLLVMALNYYTGHRLADSPLRGKISRYAWGEDYHPEIKHRLEMMLEFIRRQVPSARGICYADTGPVMEKIWGAQTKLGWMGKHTNLISRNRGSWFFIGVILLDIELEYDAREKNYCGKCVRCIQSCPTGAIVEPYVLDARLCISYLTIELRGSIPRSLRPLIGNRIFGCDDCQEACPWNRFAVATTERPFCPSDGILMPELMPLVQITPHDFNDRFESSAIRRVTRDCFVRNVVVALGNSGNAEVVPALQEALRDGSPLIRSHAAWALGQIGTVRARRTLEQAQAGEDNGFVLEEISAALEKTS
jgi:epoxyqueuosine reductase